MIAAPGARLGAHPKCASGEAGDACSTGRPERCRNEDQRVRRGIEMHQEPVQKRWQRNDQRIGCAGLILRKSDELFSLREKNLQALKLL
jgi:hypothetical protein